MILTTRKRFISSSYLLMMLTVVMLMLNGIPAQAQSSSMNMNDLSKIQVDELTDAQIKQFISRAEESGMTQEQLEAAAMARGMPYSEITKLRDRINKIQQGRGKTTTVSNEMRGVSGQELSKRKDLFTNIMADTTTISKTTKESTGELKVFGSDLFNRENLTFEPSLNIPTPQNYQLGPGDELLIEIWGASQEEYRLQVTPEGYIKIANLSPLQVSGLTIEKATQLIKSRLSNIYAGMHGPNPNTFAQVSIGNLRSIKVNLAGEVEMPGTYTLPSLASVFNALYLAGGPGKEGSYRNISVIRENKLVATVDLYDFLLHGMPEKNIRLQDQDIIFVNPYQARVMLDGEVKKPAIYEVAGQETLSDVIGFAGGFKDDAYQDRIKIVRNTPTEKMIVDVQSAQFATTALKDGDEIQVDKILSRFKNRVTIRGAVYREGEFELTDGMTLKQLIARADGLRKDAFLPRASIYRLSSNLKMEMIPVNLVALMNGETAGIPLQREDVVNISSIFDLEEIYTVKINGAVKKPGTYPWVKALSLGELIRNSGGLLESASLAKVEIARRVRDKHATEPKPEVASIYTFALNQDLSLSDSASSFVLEPYDMIFIRKSPGYETQQLVQVEGEVAFPGQYSIANKGERISDLVNRAGGLTSDAYLPGASLIRQVKINEEQRTKALEALQYASGDSIQLEKTGMSKEQAIGIELSRILEKPHSDYDLILMEGDRLQVPKQLQTVRLSGALLYPVTVRFENNRSLRNYISHAGGFAEEARPSKAYVIYANGSVDRTKSFLFIRNYPKIEPGAEIVVPKKPEREKLSAQQAISISSAVASMALVLVTLIGKL